MASQEWYSALFHTACIFKTKVKPSARLQKDFETAYERVKEDYANRELELTGNLHPLIVKVAKTIEDAKSDASDAADADGADKGAAEEDDPGDEPAADKPAADKPAADKPAAENPDEKKEEIAPTSDDKEEENEE